MNFRRLMHFLNHEMKMREIYQPWLIRYLVFHDGESSVDGVAGDIPQPNGAPRYNRHLTPISVLSRHGIVEERPGGRLKLTTWPVSESERVQVLTRCEELIRTFERKRQWPK